MVEVDVVVAIIVATANQASTPAFRIVVEKGEFSIAEGDGATIFWLKPVRHCSSYIYGLEQELAMF